MFLCEALAPLQCDLTHCAANTDTVQSRLAACSFGDDTDIVVHSADIDNLYPKLDHDLIITVVGKRLRVHYSSGRYASFLVDVIRTVLKNQVVL